MDNQEFFKKLKAWQDKSAPHFEGMDGWHFRRMSGIGGSEIAAVMGKNKYKTPHQLWLEKTFKVPPFTGNAATLKGQILEDAVAKYYEDATGNAVEKDDTHYRAEDAPWLVGNIDRRIVSGGILECKTTARNPSDDETEDGYQWGLGNEYDEDKNLIATDEQIPLNYYLQVQHYMCLTNSEFADVAVLFLASDFKPFRVYRIERNEEVIEKIKTSAHDFMQMVFDDVEPPMTEDELVQKYKETPSVDESVELDGGLIEELRAVKAKIKDLETKKDEVENSIKILLGDRAVGTICGKKAVTWKERNYSRIDTEKLKTEWAKVYEECLKTTTIRTLVLSRSK